MIAPAQQPQPWRQAFELPPDQPIYEWIESNITIPPSYPGNFSGPYRVALTPYLRGIFDALRDPRINTITIMKGAQTGLSLLIHLFICWAIKNDPCPIIFFLPTTDLARDVSQTKLQVLIDHNPVMAEDKPTDPDKFTKLQYMMARCVVTLSGANNATQTASRNGRIVVVDETDKIPKRAKDEASPIKLAVERAKTFWNKKIVYVSTPTTAKGHIAKSFALSDQRKLFCRCPHCGHEQVLSFKVVRFDKDGTNARYFCESCSADWTRMETLNAIDRAEWRATATPRDPRHAGFHIPSFYSRWVDVQDIVNEFLDCKDDPKELQNLINSTFAEVFTDTPSRQASASSVWKFRDRHKYDRGTIPFPGRVIPVLVSDVQDKYCIWAVWAVGLRDHALVDHGDAATPADVVDIARRTYKRGDEEHAIRVAGIDTGHRTDEVYDACVEMKRIPGLVVIPIKGDTGASTTQSEPIRTQRIGTYPDGSPLPRNESIILRHLHPRYFHDIGWAVLEPLQSVDNLTEEEVFQRRKIRLHLHREIDRHFVDGITGEWLVEDENGKTTIKGRKNNHQWDNFRYSLAIRKLLKNDLAEPQPPPQQPPAKPDTVRPGSAPTIVLEQITL